MNQQMENIKNTEINNHYSLKQYIITASIMETCKMSMKIAFIPCINIVQSWISLKFFFVIYNEDHEDIHKEEVKYPISWTVCKHEDSVKLL
jgi:hypothetical protein